MMIEEKSLRDIVLDNAATASVLEKYGLDFCCKGGLSLQLACATKAIDSNLVMNELSQVGQDESAQRIHLWDLPFLIDYIINNHHAYVRRQTPVLFIHLDKIARVHAASHPEFKEVEKIFRKVGEDLQHHMVKEERMLFPAIKMLSASRSQRKTLPQMPFGSITAPISMMISEHETAGEELAEIRSLLHDYTPPDDGCTTVRVTYQELADFEKDLHKHVFLENSVLFPKATALEKEVEFPQNTLAQN
jgi:regulator of cell morphogenesis and NO signaling